MTPAEYFISVGRKFPTKLQKFKHQWNATTVASILDRQEYIGDTVILFLPDLVGFFLLFLNSCAIFQVYSSIIGWVIDETSAEVVKEIYNLFIQGHGTFEIARILTKRNIMTPADENILFLPDLVGFFLLFLNCCAIFQVYSSIIGSWVLAKKRIIEIDTLFQHIYEDNISGKLTDERFIH